MSNTIKHKTLPAGTDRPGFTGITPSLYAEEHSFAGGHDGSVLVKNSANSDSAAWVQSLKGVLAASGTNAIPAFTEVIPNSTANFIADYDGFPVEIGSGLGNIGQGAGIRMYRSSTLEYSIYAGVDGSGRPSIVFDDIPNHGTANTSIMNLYRGSAVGSLPADYHLVPNGSTVSLFLGDDTSGQRWSEVNSAIVRATTAYYERFRTVPIGEWTTEAFSAGNFTSTGGGTAWTVASGDQARYRYMLVGKTMFLEFEINTSDVTGTPTNLLLKVPGGFTIGGTTRGFFTAIDHGGAPVVGMAIATAAATSIALYSTVTGTGWAATGGSNDTYAIGQIKFEIQ